MPPAAPPPRRAGDGATEEPPLIAARAWLDAHAGQAVVVPHDDADGLSAGAILRRVAGGGALHVQTPWEGEIAPGRPAIVADWGVRPVEGPSTVLYVDHHAEPEPVDGVVLHADATGDPSTSVLAWRLLGCPEPAAWLAALGAVGDLGERALQAPGVPRAGSLSALRRLAALVTAPSRVRDGPVADALAVLLAADGPAAALADPRTARLDAARREAQAHRAAAVRVAPSVGPAAALIRLDVPVRVHGQVASAWVRRLAPRVVIVANAGWRPDRVSFAARCHCDLDLRAWLRAVYSPPEGSGDYARGHARATGGSLVPEAFEAFAEAVLAAPAPGN